MKGEPYSKPTREGDCVRGTDVDSIPALHERLRLRCLADRCRPREGQGRERDPLRLGRPEANCQLLPPRVEVGDLGFRLARSLRERKEEAEGRRQSAEAAGREAGPGESDVTELPSVDGPGLVPVAEVAERVAVEVDGERQPLIVEADDRGRIQERRGAVDAESDTRVAHERRAPANWRRVRVSLCMGDPWREPETDNCGE